MNLQYTDNPRLQGGNYIANTQQTFQQNANSENIFSRRSFLEEQGLSAPSKISSFSSRLSSLVQPNAARKSLKSVITSRPSGKGLLA